MYLDIVKKWSIFYGDVKLSKALANCKANCKHVVSLTSSDPHDKMEQEIADMAISCEQTVLTVFERSVCVLAGV